MSRGVQQRAGPHLPRLLVEHSGLLEGIASQLVREHVQPHRQRPSSRLLTVQYGGEYVGEYVVALPVADSQPRDQLLGLPADGFSGRQLCEYGSP